MSRETRRGADLTDDVYIFDRGPGFEGVEHLKKVFTVNGQTVALDAAGIKREWDANAVVQIATDDEIAAYRREQDRFAVARALNRLGSNIVDKGLPVPPGGVGIVVSLYLLDNADLGPWANWLSTRPRRGTAQPLIQADAEGVEINVYGPGNSGEFGPDLADIALTEAPPLVMLTCPVCGEGLMAAPAERCMDCAIESGPMYDERRVQPRDCGECYPGGFSPGTFEGPQRDCSVHGENAKPPSYDANPTINLGDPHAYEVYAAALDLSNPGWWNDDRSRMAYELANEADKRRSEEAALPEPLKPERDGWPVSDGHRPPVDDDAMKHDRHSGEG